ncbi:hypothetical protein S40293_02636 [Stachybotrys chartarum IBT 40293]|nr:hypothetical protein S40293_02636 [Stachybotrys chartarum IBT 40293]
MRNRARSHVRRSNSTTPKTDRPAFIPESLTDPSLLLKHFLEEGKNESFWKRVVASSRATRLPIVLMQLKLRRDLLTDWNHPLLKYLPTEAEWNRTMDRIRYNGYSEEDLDGLLHILTATDDNERCRRFLRPNTHQPIFLLNFLLRRKSTLSETQLLAKLIDYCGTWYHGRKVWEKGETKPYQGTQKRAQMAMLSMDVANFNRLVSLLSHRCLWTEPRLIVNVSAFVAQFLTNMTDDGRHPDELYGRRCSILNASLQSFRLTTRRHTHQVEAPNPYLWEAQRHLLSASAEFDKPLAVEKEGFRAIREVLAGLPKNAPEIQSSLRHAPTWPPYLLPSTGLDETKEVEESWSRVVQAGVLMQEAGNAKEDQDEALDILGGLAPDGTPTIQQRVTLKRDRQLGSWEARILATRNAHEAWKVFQDPPEPGREAGPAEYAAMFEKLTMREAEPETDALPGDKRLSFPTKGELNLTDLEKVRIQPPSVTALCQQMRLARVPVDKRCLQLLIESATSINLVHEYLQESDEDVADCNVRCLLSSNPNKQQLQQIPMGLFAAYVHACAGLKNHPRKRYLRKAIHLIHLRMNKAEVHWLPYLYRPVLKALAQHRKGLGMTLSYKLQFLLDIISQLDADHGVPLSMFTQFAICLRRTVAYEIKDLPAKRMGKPGPLLYKLNSLPKYDSEGSSGTEIGFGKAASLSGSHRALFSEAGGWLKRLFTTLVESEKESQSLLETHQVSILEQMRTRRDPVRVEHARQYLLALAYLGEFAEMARALKWLIAEWAQPDVIAALEGRGGDDLFPELSEPLHIFRLFAEPMLSPEVGISVQKAVEKANLATIWPDDDSVQAYGKGHNDESVMMLVRVLREAPQAASAELDSVQEPAEAIDDWELAARRRATVKAVNG